MEISYSVIFSFLLVIHFCVLFFEIALIDEWKCCADFAHVSILGFFAGVILKAWIWISSLVRFLAFLVIVVTN